MKIFSTRSQDIEISNLLRGIQEGNIQLPEFQRDWTWDDERIRGIIASLAQGYPMGAIMQLEYGNSNVKFKCRAFEGVHLNDETLPAYLVLDGQQRLTSIFLSTSSSEPVSTKTPQHKKIKRFYYLSINDCLSEDTDLFDAVLALPEDRMKKENFDRDIVLDLSSREKEFENHMFPLNIIFDSSAREDWSDDYKDYHGNSSEIKEQYKKFRNTILDTITGYKLPVIRLDKNTPRDAVCKVFENVNTGGVVLTVFELVTATFATYDFDLRKDWEQCQKVVIGAYDVRRKLAANANESKIEFYDLPAPLRTDIFEGIDATHYLTALTLYVSYLNKKAGSSGAISCKKKDVLSLKFEDYLEHQEAILKGFHLAREFLVQYQCIFRKRDLPYQTQIIPLVAVLAYLKKLNKHSRQILSQWYWCGILGEMYGGANETRYANDIEDIINSIEGKESKNSTISTSFFYSNRLLTLHTRNSAAYKGILGLLYKEKCIDFKQEIDINAASSMTLNLDIHHIFPEAYCKQNNIKREKYNSIVNKTPLLAETNRAIGGKAPEIYLQKIMKEDNITEDEIKHRVKSHLIHYKHLKNNNFDAYFIDRAIKLLTLIEKAMGKGVSDRGSQETQDAFGAALIDWGEL